MGTFVNGTINKRKERIIFRPGHVFWEEGNRKGFILQTVSSSCGGRERTQVTDDCTGVHPPIPDWLVKITFLGGIN